MIAHILLQALVAHYDAKSSARVHIDGFLQIQLVQGNYLLGGLRSTLLNGNEMYLAVHEPIVGHAICRAVFQIEPHQVAILRDVDVRWIFIGGRDYVILRNICIGRERHTATVKSPTPIRTVVRPTSVIEPPPAGPEQEKPWAEEHAVTKTVNGALVKVESMQLGSRWRLTGKNGGPRNRCMCS